MNKIALITGASRGIGAALARVFAQNGYHLALCCHKSDAQLDALANELSEQYHIEICTFTGDVGDYAFVEQMVNKTLEKFSKIDVLVNNAGISYIGLLTDMQIEDWNHIVATNLTSVFSTCRCCVPSMVLQKSGKIINISSVSGILGNAGQANYAASKAGVIGLTKTMARELGSRGITVNAIAPGFVDTEMTEVLSEELKESACKQIILGRFGKPEDIANAAVFLVSDKADYITGQVISVDGGMNV